LCEQRDLKGLYKLARTGEIENFTGISSPYEPPENPELVFDTERTSLGECVDQVLALLYEKKII
jgi:adenylylsulfate kinase